MRKSQLTRGNLSTQAEECYKAFDPEILMVYETRELGTKYQLNVTSSSWET